MVVDGWIGWDRKRIGTAFIRKFNFIVKTINRRRVKSTVCQRSIQIVVGPFAVCKGQSGMQCLYLQIIKSSFCLSYGR